MGHLSNALDSMLIIVYTYEEAYGAQDTNTLTYDPDATANSESFRH